MARFWCYECDKEFVASEDEADLHCPDCDGSFVELMEDVEESENTFVPPLNAAAPDPLNPPTFGATGMRPGASPFGGMFDFQTIFQGLMQVANQASAQAQSAQAEEARPGATERSPDDEGQESNETQSENGQGNTNTSANTNTTRIGPFQFTFSSSTHQPGQSQFVPNSSNPNAGGANMNDPAAFIDSLMQGLMQGGANPFQQMMAPMMAGGTTIGDYHFGPSLDQLISRLMDESGPTGTPPAAKEEIENLPSVKVTAEEVEKTLECPVCMDQFKVEEEVRQMPCNHKFHNICLLPWLEAHNNCPVCRTELRTNDPDYEARRAQQGSQ